jgi:hypothetical protein
MWQHRFLENCHSFPYKDQQKVSFLRNFSLRIRIKGVDGWETGEIGGPVSDSLADRSLGSEPNFDLLLSWLFVGFSRR